MRKTLSILSLGFLLVACDATKSKTNDLAINTPIKTALDLTAVNDDRVPVSVNPGRFIQDTVTYRLPRVIQGTYSVSDFGKYIDDFTAIDYEGNNLTATKEGDNTWKIVGAKNLDKITYYVNDTYDIETSGGIGGEQPFSPAGTNIESDNYVLNLHGFIGYFDELKSNQYTLDVTAPIAFDRTSALQSTGETTSEDGNSLTTTYFAPRYFDITDNPMMYGDLDVEEFMVGDIKIVLSLFSPNKTHTAASLKETVYEMMEAQKAYLGEINTTSRYDIYVYLSEGKEDSPKGFGALEHQTSTVAVFSEAMPLESLKGTMIDVIAHEFFHIVTPLSVHSEDVHYFDYNEPTFSKHLWMYEGVTEYFAQHFQVYKDLVESQEFYNTINDKIMTSKNLDDSMSFTMMSENVLEEPYASNYYNVYMKGALIGMCVDILMRKESNGERSMLSLMKELSNKYGVDQPFEDDLLIAEITEMTYPSVGKFLTTHVEGETPINYDEFFEMVGLTKAEKEVETNFIFSGGQNIIFGADQEKAAIIFKANALNNSFWKSQNIQAGDVIKKVNGSELTMANAQQTVGMMYSWQVGQEITMELERDGEVIQIETTLTKPVAVSESIVEDENATAEQVVVRKAWLNE
jgi:predicted metalloprotease with PDZ domain